jgi:tRNA(fMet)-specific endonuclease VapC
LTPRYLIDTCVISERLKPAPDEGIVEKMRRHEGEIATGSPVWHELVYGCSLLPISKKRNAIEEYLLRVVAVGIPILPYDSQAADWHGKEQARLAREGQTPPFVDGQIAAIARIHDLEIITVNVKDYLPFEGVRIRDWRR